MHPGTPSCCINLAQLPFCQRIVLFRLVGNNKAGFVDAYPLLRCGPGEMHPGKTPTSITRLCHFPLLAVLRSVTLQAQVLTCVARPLGNVCTHVGSKLAHMASNAINKGLTPRATASTNADLLWRRQALAKVWSKACASSACANML